ncbi:hypothetical protein P3T20_004759 [Paraburkholderia sp. GAS206C]|jgi:hypothetical protein
MNVATSSMVMNGSVTANHASLMSAAGTAIPTQVKWIGQPSGEGVAVKWTGQCATRPFL